jgi:hypothetical protein
MASDGLATDEAQRRQHEAALLSTCSCASCVTEVAVSLSRHPDPPEPGGGAPGYRHRVICRVTTMALNLAWSAHERLFL